MIKHKPFVLVFVGTDYSRASAGSGSGSGSGMRDSRGEECYNANNVYKTHEETNKLASSGVTARVLSEPWSDRMFCHELVRGSSVAPNEETFRSQCEELFGPICRHQCADVAELFDRLDMSVFPPSASMGGVGYKLNAEDCVDCLERGDCHQKPRADWQMLASRTHLRGQMLNKNAMAIMNVLQTPREGGN